MPSIFFKADFVATIRFLEEHDPSSWDEVENEDDVYQTINFQINDPDNPVAPALIHIANNEAVSGSFTCTKLSEKVYTFSISGIFKTSVHKDAVRLLNSGLQPVLDGFSRNLDGWAFYDDFQPTLSNTDWLFASKKSEINDL